MSDLTMFPICGKCLNEMQQRRADNSENIFYPHEFICLECDTIVILQPIKKENKNV